MTARAAVEKLHAELGELKPPPSHVSSAKSHPEHQLRARGRQGSCPQEGGRLTAGAAVEKLHVELGELVGLEDRRVAQVALRARLHQVPHLHVRTHVIIVMIRWTGLAPWEFDRSA